MVKLLSTCVCSCLLILFSWSFDLSSHLVHKDWPTFSLVQRLILSVLLAGFWVELSTGARGGPLLVQKGAPLQSSCMWGRWYCWLGSKCHRQTEFCFSSSSCNPSCRNRKWYGPSSELGRWFGLSGEARRPLHCVASHRACCSDYAWPMENNNFTTGKATPSTEIYEQLSWYVTTYFSNHPRYLSVVNMSCLSQSAISLVFGWGTPAVWIKVATWFSFAWFCTQ